MRKVSLFEDFRMTLEDAIEMSLASLNEYGSRYRHWIMAYSGGKDSSAVVTFVAWAIREGLIPRPESVTVEYADTRQEYPVLYSTAMSLLAALEAGRS
jgi:DNA sulfur modification protein DndC